ncbi:MAG: hypothetical protein WD688_18275 [Candidatus Binatia bacterium]
MSKVHFIIGSTSTEAVDLDRIALALLPDTTYPAAVPTYCRQLYQGSRVLLRLGNANAIVTTHFLPRFRTINEDILSAKKQELDSLRMQLEGLTESIPSRAQIFLTYLASKGLIDRRLYAAAEKIRRQDTLTTKDLTPLVDAVYNTLRKTAGATSSHKQNIRDYIQTGVAALQLFDWLARFVGPEFHMYQRHHALTLELQGSENRAQPENNAVLEKDLTAAVEEIEAGIPCAREVHGVNVQRCLEDVTGCDPRGTFFAEIKEVRQGLNKQGCLVVAQVKIQQDSGAPSYRFISLDKFSRIVSALDRALSRVVITFANNDAAMKELCQDHVLHSGLLIRALLGESESVRLLYPTHVVAIPNNPGLSDAIVSQTRKAYENGLLARVCASHYGLKADEFMQGLQKAVSIQRKLMPLLPWEVHRLVDAIEGRIRLQKIIQDRRASRATITAQQASNLSVAMSAQLTQQKQIGSRLKADFRIEPSKMFYLDDCLIDKIKMLFGSEFEFLRPVLKDYIERRKSRHLSETEQD